MTTVLKGSLFSILKLERLQLHPVDKKVLKNDVQVCLRQHEFTIHPGTKLQQKTSKVEAKKKLSISVFALLTLTIIVCSIVVKTTFPYPSHASCLVKWEFGEPCAFVVQRLRSQIIEWSRYKYCGLKCLYKMKESFAYENNTIQALRVFPKYNIVDEIDIVFADLSDHSCTALAKSRSKGWYTLFDDGRNYCNLHDLMVGTGYDGNSNFLEFTSNIMCTQYDMAYCD